MQFGCIIISLAMIRGKIRASNFPQLNKIIYRHMSEALNVTLKFIHGLVNKFIIGHSINNSLVINLL